MADMAGVMPGSREATPQRATPRSKTRLTPDRLQMSPKVLDYLTTKIEEIQSARPAVSRQLKRQSPEEKVTKNVEENGNLLYTVNLGRFEDCPDTTPRTSACNSNNSTLNRSTEYSFMAGQQVLARWNDGLYYLGTILDVDTKNQKCQIRYEDNSEYWTLFKDIQKDADYDASSDDIHCCICQDETSNKPNEIVLCDNCGQGYHQACHSPAIDSSVLQPDVEWLCRQCIFATTVKMKQLHWDRCHKNNVEQCYCYCGGPGDWYLRMLQCCRCKQWFHEACTQCLDYPLVYGDRFYIFICSLCNSGHEYIKRLELKWLDIAQLLLFNLTIEHNKKYYEFADLTEWLNCHWDELQLSNAASRHERANKLQACLFTNKSKFASGREIKKKQSLWGLRVRLPPQPPTIILPQYGEITDEIMSSPQMKGKKTISFVPVQGNTPVPFRKRLRDAQKDDSHKSRKLSMEPMEVENSRYDEHEEYKGLSGNVDVYDFREDSPIDVVRAKTTPVPECCSLIDKLIPTLDSYDGLNHPFKTILEVDEESQQLHIKKRILNWYQGGCENELDLSSRDDPASGVEESSGVYNWSDSTPCPDGNSGSSQVAPPLTLKKRGRKPKSEVLRLQALVAWQEEAAAKKAEEAKKHAAEMKRIENKVKNYLSSTKTARRKGEGFNVLARRVTPDGKVQYLVRWEGII